MAISLEPSFAGAWNNCAAAYGQTKDYETSLRCAEKALEIEPQYSKALFSKIVSLKNLKRKEEAKTALAQFIRLNPRNVSSPEIIDLNAEIAKLD